MEKKDIKAKYTKFLKEIDASRIYDGRGSWIDVYRCDKCNHVMLTKYKDKGVTPFTMKCSVCGCGTMWHDETVGEGVVETHYPDIKIKNWVRPTLEQCYEMSDWDLEHVFDGGLYLDDNELVKGEEVVIFKESAEKKKVIKAKPKSSKPKNAKEKEKKLKKK